MLDDLLKNHSKLRLDHGNMLMGFNDKKQMFVVYSKKKPQDKKYFTYFHEAFRELVK